MEHKIYMTTKITIYMNSQDHHFSTWVCETFLFKFSQTYFFWGIILSNVLALNNLFLTIKFEFTYLNCISKRSPLTRTHISNPALVHCKDREVFWNCLFQYQSCNVNSLFICDFIFILLSTYSNQLSNIRNLPLMVVDGAWLFPKSLSLFPLHIN